MTSYRIGPAKNTRAALANEETVTSVEWSEIFCRTVQPRSKLTGCDYSIFLLTHSLTSCQLSAKDVLLHGGATKMKVNRTRLDSGFILQTSNLELGIS